MKPSHFPAPLSRRPDAGLGTLARALVRAGVISRPQADSLGASGQPFVLALTQSGAVEGAWLARFITDALGYPQIAPDALDVARLPLGSIPDALLQTRLILPLSARAKHLCVAMADPTDRDTLDRLRALGFTVEVSVAEIATLQASLAHALQASEWTHQSLAQQ